MPWYRIFTLSKDEHIESPPRVIVSKDDETALKEARQLLDGHAFEVWDENRKVGRLEPED